MGWANRRNPAVMVSLEILGRDQEAEGMPPSRSGKDAAFMRLARRAIRPAVLRLVRGEERSWEAASAALRMPGLKPVVMVSTLKRANQFMEARANQR